MHSRPPSSTLFPYTTLFRSLLRPRGGSADLRFDRGSRTDQRHANVGHPPERHRRRDHVLRDRKSTRLNSSHSQISYAVFCLKKKKTNSGKRTSHQASRLSLT